MANTLIPIQTYTLTSTTASVTFSNIPQNYTDIKIVASARTARSDNGDYALLSLNGSEANSGVTFWGYGTTVATSNTTNNVLIVPGNTATSSVFGNLELYCPNYTNSGNKTVSTDSSAEDNTVSSNGNSIGSLLWSSGSAATSAVTSITLTGRFGSFLSGSTFTLYGVSNGVKATGGTLTVAGGYAYHTFTATGSFLPNQRIKGAEVLVVAGGGGGCGYGAGGAGGLSYKSSSTFEVGSYTAIVGSGGASGISAGGAVGGSGTNSIFAGITSNGGGGGRTNNTGLSGGSGAGGSYSNQAGGAATQGNTGGAIGYGNAGGAGYSNNTTIFNAGGGGGAGAAGIAGTVTPNNGGDGLQTWASWAYATGTGESGYYAGGGGGCSRQTDNMGRGGRGGGGAGGNRNTSAPAGAAVANTGGGGGAGDDDAGGAGASGIVIVRYPLS
jgi:hypothetical protein